MRGIRSLLLASTALVPLSLVPALANPLDPNIVAGTASVAGSGTTNLTVTQSSDKAIIDWRSFNIGTTEATQFVQPSTNSVTLNRVTGGEGASQILGTLKGNGQIFLVNPDGILFGKDARVDVGGLVATSNDISNSDFLSGKLAFGIPGSSSASVVNLGTITAADGGFAALVAPGVRNDGIITARLGKIGLGSADSFTLDLYGDSLINLAVSDVTAETVIDVSTGKPLKSLVANAGLLKADGGSVQLTAAAARAVVDNTGTIEANSVGIKNGKIVLSAATAGTKPSGLSTQRVTVSGALSASGLKPGESGGKVQISGEEIALTEATIDAFGRSGGGKVLIGGDVGGGHGNAAVSNLATAQLEADLVPTATTTTVDVGSIINASASAAGNGGKVVVWSDGATSFNGEIQAKGGTLSGNGGFVETSGHQQLNFTGTVDAAAPNGQSGTLLLDPQDVTIGTTGSYVVTPAAFGSDARLQRCLGDDECRHRDWRHHRRSSR